jgi:hypothetical protein
MILHFVHHPGLMRSRLSGPSPRRGRGAPYFPQGAIAARLTCAGCARPAHRLPEGLADALQRVDVRMTR